MGSPGKKFLFIVQGEGRGHMTQAIGLYQLLKQHGHQVIHIFIGKSNRRIIPSYFFDHFDVPIEMIDSPNFITDKLNKAIRLGASIIYNAGFLNKYWTSLDQINRVVKASMPDAIVSFYDFKALFFAGILYKTARLFMKSAEKQQRKKKHKKR